MHPTILVICLASLAVVSFATPFRTPPHNEIPIDTTRANTIDADRDRCA